MLKELKNQLLVSCIAAVALLLIGVWVGLHGVAWLSAALSIIVCLYLIGVNLWFSSRVSEPIAKLSDHARRIAEGTYGIKLEKERDDELGVLTEEINDMSEKVAIAEKSRTEFISQVSHELRTPLTIIVGYLENLMEDNLMEESPGLARKFIGVMHQNSQRLMNIIEDMLMISKLESGHKAILKEQWFHLTSCVDDVFSRLDSIREKKQAALHMNIPPDWELYGDPFYWTQVLFNLVENALKQNTEPGLSVTVAAARTPEACVITVTDTGVGIPAESLPFLFNRFYRVETHHSSEIKGTGLGLSIVKRAVEAHDGAITVSSTPHRETVFTITIPLKRFREEKEA